jgi:hypothetical protein
MLSVRRPIEVVVLNCCVTETNEASWASSTSTIFAKSASDRVRRVAAAGPGVLRRQECEQQERTEPSGPQPCRRGAKSSPPHDFSCEPDEPASINNVMVWTPPTQRHLVV